jgi:small subunit ribosomal protein S21
MSLAEVRLQEGESLENALRRFKRKVQTEDIIKDVKRHSFYLKPGEKRRVKQALARKRARKKIRKDSEEAASWGVSATERSLSKVTQTASVNRSSHLVPCLWRNVRIGHGSLNRQQFLHNPAQLG